MRPVHVLLVEDDEADRALVHAALADPWRDQYVVHDAADLKAARRALAKGGMGAVILDLGLPDADGLDGVTALLSAEVPIVVLTGRDEDKTSDAALDAGASDFLSKNHLTAELLERTIRYAILRHRRRAGDPLTMPLEVLHLEDDPADCELVRKALHQASVPVRYGQAMSMQEARPLLPRAHVVLIDLNLPDSHGTATVRAIRRAAPHAALIVITQVDDLDQARDAIDAGASDYLVKGLLMPEQIERAVAFAMEQRAWEEAK